MREVLMLLAETSPEGVETVLFWWVVGLFALAFVFGVLELFIPSGGLLGVVGGLCALIGVGAAFRIGPMTGLSALGFVVVAVPTFLWAALKVFPSTPIGRQIILSEGATDDDFQRRRHLRLAETEAISALVGARARTLTDLRPGGTIRLDGEDVEAFAETGFIGAGSEVEITTIIGRQIKVRPVADSA